MATVKHYIGNEQEHYRQAHEWALPNALSSNIGDRTVHELYLWPFADAVKAGVASVMCSYQMTNNSYSCGNSKLLNGILKDELGFQGFVQSDWLAQRSGVGTALAGLDMSMPGDGLSWQDGQSFWGPELTRSVLNGTLPLSRLNDMVTRIVAAYDVLLSGGGSRGEDARRLDRCSRACLRVLPGNNCGVRRRHTPASILPLAASRRNRLRSFVWDTPLIPDLFYAML